MESAQLTVVYGEEELFARTAHLFASAREIACAANDLYTWAATRPRSTSGQSAEQRGAATRIRKLYRPGVLLDQRLAILAGELAGGRRGYRVIAQPGVVQAVASLFDAAWRAATNLRTYEAQHAELRELAPRVLELLDFGCKDETAARTLGLGARARELGLV